MVYTINTERAKYYKQMLALVNCFFKLTEFEMFLISTMFENDLLVLTKVTRLDLRVALNTSEANFNNYISKLKEKRILEETDKGLEITPPLKNIIDNKQITVEFNVSTEDSDGSNGSR